MHGCEHRLVMKTRQASFFLLLTALPMALQAEETPTAPPTTGTVTIPYQILREMEKRLDVLKNTKEQNPTTVLRSAQYHIDFTKESPQWSAEFSVRQFSDGMRETPLFANNVAVLSLLPNDALISPTEKWLQLVTTTDGIHTCQLTLSPTEKNITSAPCAIAALRISGLGQGRAISLEINHQTQLVTTDKSIALPAAGCEIRWDLISGQDAEKAAKPLPPSTWEWNQEIAVAHTENMLHHTAMLHARTDGGDTLTATLVLPASITHIEATSENLVQQSIVRQDDLTQHLHLRWNQARSLTRNIELHYRSNATDSMEQWTLTAPTGLESKPIQAIFHLMEDPHRKFSSEGLTGPFLSEKLSPTLSKALEGRSHFRLIATDATATIQQKVLPVVAVDDAIITVAKWSTRVEEDGAILTEGQYEISHSQSSRIPLRLPKGGTLLSCLVNGSKTSPLLVDDGQWEIVLPLALDKGITNLTLSYTQQSDELAPLQGELTLQLPHTRYFIDSLQWQITLPQGYSSEVAGNMQRRANNAQANALVLEKKTCRDQQPEAILFYNNTPVSSN